MSTRLLATSLRASSEASLAIWDRIAIAPDLPDLSIMLNRLSSPIFRDGCGLTLTFSLILHQNAQRPRCGDPHRGRCFVFYFPIFSLPSAMRALA